MTFIPLKEREKKLKAFQPINGTKKYTKALRDPGFRAEVQAKVQAAVQATMRDPGFQAEVQAEVQATMRDPGFQAEVQAAVQAAMRDPGFQAAAGAAILNNPAVRAAAGAVRAPSEVVIGAAASRAVIDGQVAQITIRKIKNIIQQQLEKDAQIVKALNSSVDMGYLTIAESYRIQHFKAFLKSIEDTCSELKEKPFFKDLKKCISEDIDGILEGGMLRRISACVRNASKPSEYLLNILHRSLSQFIDHKRDVIQGRELVGVVESVAPLLKMAEINDLRQWIKTQLIDAKSNSTTPHQFIAILDKAKQGQISQAQAAKEIIQLAKKSTESTLGAMWSRSHVFGRGRAESYHECLESLASLTSKEQTITGILAKCKSMIPAASVDNSASNSTNNKLVHDASAAGLVPTFFNNVAEKVKGVFGSSNEDNAADADINDSPQTSAGSSTETTSNEDVSPLQVSAGPKPTVQVV